MFLVPPVERIEPPSAASATRIDEVTRSLDHFHETKKEEEKSRQTFCVVCLQRETIPPKRTGRAGRAASDQTKRGCKIHPVQATSPSQGTSTRAGFWPMAGNDMSHELFTLFHKHTINRCRIICVN